MAEKNSKKTFYITTPIYYVNDIPHIGHAYTTIIADAISRYKKLAGYDVFFLTGTDEHGQKIEKSAAARGITPIELADQVVGRFKNLWKALNIDFDGFVRTTQSIHEKTVQKIFHQLKEKGDIYKGLYQGYYCVSDENFLSDDIPLEKEGHKVCPDCGKHAGKVSEECYFFKLSAYQEKLLDYYKSNPQFIRPQTRMNEIVRFVELGLKDLSITRTTVKWGIPVPDDPAHTVYVWFDALHNYLSGIGYDWDLERYNKFWPAQIHLIGKDILRFHAVFWPAFLMAAGFPLPETVFGHGWWLKDKSKMSKSKGNVLDPHVILNTFGTDALRYFLLREIPIGLDGNFSHEGFIHRVNSDLANDLGNLAQRTLTMILKYFNGRIDTMEEEREDDIMLKESWDQTIQNACQRYDGLEINRALEEIWTYINIVNKYLADNEPWQLAKDSQRKPRLARILYQAAAALRAVAYILYPVMPDTSQKIWSCLDDNRKIEEHPLSEFRFEDFPQDRTFQAPEPLFPRIKLEDFLSGEENKPAIKEENVDIITFEEFQRLDLRVGKIVQAERVEGTKKLIKSQVDIGGEIRQMISGIADNYSPEDLVGKKMIVLVNLKPAVIRGVESQVMLLAAVDEKGSAIIPFFSHEVTTGAKVR